MFTLNVPNLLTVLRILLVPVLVVALLDQTSSSWLAAAVFATASLTDAIDGYIARARAQILYWAFLGYARSDHSPRKAHADPLIEELVRMAVR